MGKLVAQGFRVLMVDDSPDDIFLVKRAFDRSGRSLYFASVSDGQQAIEYLRGQGQYGDRQQFPFPNVLLLDLKMPGMDGFALLEWLQEHTECKVIPTIALTSSSIERDIHAVYALGGNAYLVKPSSFNEMQAIVELIYQFWSRCETPHPPPGEKC